MHPSMSTLIYHSCQLGSFPFQLFGHISNVIAECPRGGGGRSRKLALFAPVLPFFLALGLVGIVGVAVLGCAGSQSNFHPQQLAPSRIESELPSSAASGSEETRAWVQAFNEVEHALHLETSSPNKWSDDTKQWGVLRRPGDAETFITPYRYPTPAENIGRIRTAPAGRPTIGPPIARHLGRSIYAPTPA